MIGKLTLAFTLTATVVFPMDAIMGTYLLLMGGLLGITERKRRRRR